MRSRIGENHYFNSVQAQAKQERPMVNLCQNRAEGFGPHSSIHPHLPTSCFLDTVVVPLPTWILLGFLLIILPGRLNPRRQRRASSILKPTKPIENERAQTMEFDTSPRPAIHTRVLAALYYIIVLAIVAMVSVELAQLSEANFGVGLLPFSYVGLAVVVANRLTWTATATRIENAVFWILFGTALTLKVAAQIVESDEAVAAGSRDVKIYPGGSGIVVVSVMVGLSFALAALEFAGWTGLRHAR